jgi:type I restriction enzyme M protein
LTDNFGVIEGIIGLPPKLFYGTGIPACVLILNKNKPDHLRGKVFIINADAEFGEGKNQNFLRPEDIEKITTVFDKKEDIPKYARLVDVSEIEQNDWNLNLRRYVDNAPEPEPEDVRAHLYGGVPKVEVDAKQPLFDKFDFDPMRIFKVRDDEYFVFRDEVTDRNVIRQMVENDENVKHTITEMNRHLAEWWEEAREDFSRLAKCPDAAPVEPAREPVAAGMVKEKMADYLAMPKSASLPNVRQELLDSLKTRLVPLGVLDVFQVAGVFVNWWDGIKYDLKTITQNGWSPTLIPDSYLIDEFFQKERDNISLGESVIAGLEADIAELLDQLVELMEMTPEEDQDSVATSDIKKELDTRAKTDAGFKAHKKTLTEMESGLKTAKKNLAEEKDRLTLKLVLKRYGRDDAVREAEGMLAQARTQLANTTEPKKVKAIERDTAKLLVRIAATDELIDEIGGMITEPQCRELILKKHHNYVLSELDSYGSQTLSVCINALAQFHEKYSTSLSELSCETDLKYQSMIGVINSLGVNK